MDRFLDAMQIEAMREMIQEQNQTIAQLQQQLQQQQQQIQQQAQDDQQLRHQMNGQAAAIIDHIRATTPAGDNQNWLMTQKIAAKIYQQNVRGKTENEVNEFLEEFVANNLENGTLD